MLLACAALGVAGCVLAAVVPGTGLGDSVVYAGILASSAVLWLVGGRSTRRLRGWRLLALGLAGCALAAGVPGTGPGDAVVYAATLAVSALVWAAALHHRRPRQVRQARELGGPGRGLRLSGGPSSPPRPAGPGRGRWYPQRVRPGCARLSSPRGPAD